MTLHGGAFPCGAGMLPAAFPTKWQGFDRK